MARQNWLDDDGESTVIDDYAQKLTSFVEAMADGQIDADEVAGQEQRVVDLMKEVEPTLDDATHAKVTQLLCEMSALSIMQILNQLLEARLAASKTKFVG